MPGNTEQVNYSYTGDVVSLKRATKDALSLLSQYQAEINRLSQQDAFGKNAKASNSFQSAVRSTTRLVEQLDKKLKSVAAVQTPSFSAPLKGISSGFAGVNKVFDNVRNSTSLTTKEVRVLTSQLKNAQAGFKSNSADVETLVSKEVKFQSTLASLREKSENFRNSLESMKHSVSGAFNPLLSKLNTLQNPFVKVVSTIQTFKSKFSESFGRVRQMADAVTSAFRRVKQSEDDVANSANKASTSHVALGNNISKISKEVDSESDLLNEEKDTLKTKDKQINTSSSSHDTFSAIIKHFTTVIKTEIAHLNKLTSSFKKLAPSITNISNLFRSLKGFIIGSGLAEAAKQSINYAENLNLFNVALGEAAGTGRQFVSQMQELYGMDPSNLMRYAGNFYQLADAISMPDEASANLALGLTKATNDIASLFNVDVEKVFSDLSSGMMGMSRAVRKYGMDIRSVTLQQTALSLGITENVENMSEANRQGLRFITMMKQAVNASGDFAKTIEQPANQLRIFKEQMSQLGRSIGNLFITPLATAIQYINGFVMALRVAITFIGTLLGYTEDMSDTGSTMEDTADNINGIGSSAGKASKALKKFLAPFDELNVMQSKANSGGGGGGISSELLNPAIQDAIAEMKWKLEDIKMKANEVRDSILKFFGFKVDAGSIISWDSKTFENNLIKKFPKWSKTIKAVFANWSKIVEGFKAVLKALGVVAKAVWDKVAGFLGKFINDDTVSTFVSDLGKSLSDLASYITDNSDAIADFIVTVMSIVSVAAILAGVATTVGSVVARIAGIASVIIPLTSYMGYFINKINALSLAMLVLYSNSESFAESFNNLMTSLWTNLQPVLYNIQNLFVTIWESIQMLWEEHVQPMLDKTGEALSSVLETISSLWQNCSVIVADFVSLLETTWIEIIEPIFIALCDIVEDVMETFQILWDEFLGPIIKEIGNSVENMWTKYLKPTMDSIIRIIGNVIDIIMVLWNVVLAPLVKFLTTTLAPVFNAVFQYVWAIIEWVFGNMFNVVSMLFGVFTGVTDFIAGVFTGDWRKALSGLLNIFVSLGNGIIGALENTANYVIKIINSMISYIGDGVKGLINGLGGVVEDIASFLGYNINLSVSWKTPKIPTVSIPRIPKVALANGGVVTSPTAAMIGEGRYDEAVIPLGNSPQMRDLVNEIAEAVKSNGSDTDMVPVQVYMDGDLFFETMARKNRTATIRTGVNPMLGG